ncbi:hypothetical protein [Rhodocyclus tenuis]|uniref:AraC-like DNA-binding protein n=1 Tax=Rhodocyclus tenuis TaxID=1066 RepID=A0A840FW52_RHOTE|nr:hypothetical protein [Rhodocyclus tenuis]MBB4245984.1 AraC-like DNA-binding protein [Rhodocyclus tenuis]
MKTRTVWLPPGRVAPGMTLAVPVIGRDGKTLLAAGVTLDPTTLDRLTRRGVEALAVSEIDARDPAELARERAASEERLRHLFRGEGSDARSELHAALLAWRLEELQ